MNQTKFTQGPWDIFPNPTTKRACIGRFETHSNLVIEVAEVAFNDSEWQANARLISKAPEMFEALDWFSEYAAQHPEWTERFLDHASSPEREWFTAVRTLLNAIQDGGRK